MEPSEKDKKYSDISITSEEFSLLNRSEKIKTYCRENIAAAKD